MAAGYKRNSAEETLIKQVISVLIATGCTAWRQSNHGVLDPEKVAKLIGARIASIQLPTYPSGRDMKLAYGTELGRIVSDLPKLIAQCYRPTAEGRRGVPDILAFSSTGQFLAVEVKIGTDTLSPYQIAFANEMKQKEAMFFVAKDINSFKAMFAHRMTHAPNLR